MITPAKVIEVATGEIGYDRFVDPEPGTKYGRWYSIWVKDKAFAANGVPYCAMFISWLFFVVGSSLLGNGKVYAYCPYIEEDARKLGRTRSFDEIESGDVLLFDWNSDGLSDHVGIAVRRVGDYVHTIEGNTSNNSADNGGKVLRRVRHRSTVSTVVRPAYSNSPSRQESFLDIRGIQKALRATPDNVSGSDTRARLNALRAASTYGGVTFPYGVEYAQRVVGTSPDGIWGDNSAACHDSTVENLQRELNKLGYQLAIDGIYGENTDAAALNALNRAEQA